MRWIRRADAHERWRPRLQEYIANELDERSHRNADAHLESCAECRAEVEELRAVRTMLRSMPDVEVPRSFRLTPEMVAKREAPVPIRPRQPAWIPRVAQVAAGVAVFGFMSVLAIDVLGGGSSSSGDSTTALSAASDEGVADTAVDAGAAGLPSPEGTMMPSQAPPAEDAANTNELPPYEPNTARGAGTGAESTEAKQDSEPDLGSDDGGSLFATAADPGENGATYRAARDQELQPLPESGEFAPVQMPAEEEDDKRLIRSLEAVLGSVAVGLIVLAVLARPRTKS